MACFGLMFSQIVRTCFAAGRQGFGPQVFEALIECAFQRFVAIFVACQVMLFESDAFQPTLESLLAHLELPRSQLARLFSILVRGLLLVDVGLGGEFAGLGQRLNLSPRRQQDLIDAAVVQFAACPQIADGHDLRDQRGHADVDAQLRTAFSTTCRSRLDLLEPLRLLEAMYPAASFAGRRFHQVA